MQLFWSWNLKHALILHADRQLLCTLRACNAGGAERGVRAQVLKDQRKVKLEPWVLGNQTQFCMVVGQINMTAQVEEALAHAGSPLGALMHLRESYFLTYLQPMQRIAAGNVTPLARKKVRGQLRCVLGDLCLSACRPILC